MPLPNSEKKRLRQLGHNLSPVVTVAGNGLSEAVMAEVRRALDDHELIKVKLAITDREVRKSAAQQLCQQAQAELIQEIGKIALIFRAAKKPKLTTSNVRS